MHCRADLPVLDPKVEDLCLAFHVGRPAFSTAAVPHFQNDVVHQFGVEVAIVSPPLQGVPETGLDSLTSHFGVEVATVLPPLQAIPGIGLDGLTPHCNDVLPHTTG